MMQVADVVAVVEEIAPVTLAEPWDNVGLMFGGKGWPVEHVLLALDPTPAVVAQAVGLQHAMIVTHHPLFFDPIRALVEGDPAFSMVALLAKADLALYSAHTNLDKSPTHSTALALAQALGFDQVEPLAPHAGEAASAAEATACGLGCMAALPEPMPAGELARHVLRRLGSKVVQLIGLSEARPVQRLALIPGAGGDELGTALAAGADLVITGEIKHHQALQASTGAPPVLTAGHFETERPVLYPLQRYLQERLPDLDVTVAEESSPTWSVHTPDSGGS